MEKVLMAVLLAVTFSIPAWANIGDDKANVKQSYESQKDDEGKAYDQRVAKAKDDYQNDQNKLNNVINELKADHDKKIEQLDNAEQAALQKLDQQK
jgi:hypothetical protein